MPIYALGDRVPSIAPEAFVSPDAVVIGDVTIGAESSIWPGAVLRGDHGRIVIGDQTSIQDGAIIHCTASSNTIVGDRCTIGHNAHLEGCVIHDDSLIGSGAVVLAGAQVGPHALVGACALVPERRVVPSGAKAVGVPARITEGVVRDDAFDHNVAAYVRNVSWYRSELRRLD
jgi:carbonic anhydrase/acetyltransferase-like protein (isoleucine patch superfamily)